MFSKHLKELCKMQKKNLVIDNIPAVLWGEDSDKLFIAVHGDQSNKSDDVIAILAEKAAEKGYRTLSFDLPEHGERKNGSRLCNVQNCVEDLASIMKYARGISDNISLFGCSIGAYFCMLAFKKESIGQSLFLSPVVDMKRIIDNLMIGFNISEEQLRRKREIATPVKMLYWDYYEYVLKHPVEWDKQTALLYGDKDNICEFEYVNDFVKRTHADMTVLKGGEHFFHADIQLEFFRQWLQDKIYV